MGGWHQFRKEPRQLTPRHRQILALIALGITGNRHLARTLGISVRTLNNHIHEIFKRLGAGSKVDALWKAGMIRCDEDFLAHIL